MTTGRPNASCRKSGDAVPTPKQDEHEASPFVRYWLAIGKPPDGRVRGWVAALADDVPLTALVERYGGEVRRECAAHGFTPACDQPLARQPTAARQAAKQWAARVLSEGTY